MLRSPFAAIGLALLLAGPGIAASAQTVSSPAAMTPKPLNADQALRVRCVAALAIVASEQERGVGDWAGYPPLEEDGATFAGIVGEQVMKETGRTREQVRDEILKAVADLQKQAVDTDEPEKIAHIEADKCLPVLRAVVPAKPKPSLPECAVYVSLAYEEVRGREGASKTAKDLATIAAVLDHRAREMLKGEGKSEPEVDEVMGRTKERVLAQAKSVGGGGDAAKIDFPACFEMAAP